MTEDKRKQGEYEISFASRFIVLWCTGAIIGIITTVAYIF